MDEVEHASFADWIRRNPQINTPAFYIRLLHPEITRIRREPEESVHIIYVDIDEEMLPAEPDAFGD